MTRKVHIVVTVAALGALAVPLCGQTITDMGEGETSSIAIGADGLGLIAYTDYYHSSALLVSHCSNALCTVATTSIIDSHHIIDTAGPSVTIGTDDLAIISYRDIIGALKVAHCSDTACTVAAISTLDPQGGDHASGSTSIAIGGDGLALIVYKSGGPNNNRGLMVAHCSNTACTSATITTVDSTAEYVGWHPSVTKGADGFGLISYTDFTSEYLKVAHCTNAACTASTLTTLDSIDSTGMSSVKQGSDGLGLISYHAYIIGQGYHVMVAHCSDVACSAATLSPVAEQASDTSLAIGHDGLGLISYHDDRNGVLKAAHCNDVACTSATSAVVDGDLEANVTVRRNISLAIGPDGRGLISYSRERSYSGGRLITVAACANPACRGGPSRASDYDGDAESDVTVYHGLSGLWYQLWSTKEWDNTTVSLGYGGDGYVPVPGNYDGDDKTDAAVYHEASGLWFMKRSSDGGDMSIGFGGPGYMAVPQDYDGDGVTDVAVFHRDSGIWFIRPSTTGTIVSIGYGGGAGLYQPVPADYDGDGKADIAVYHAASGLWFSRYSSTGGTISLGYGGPGYVPIARDYDGDGLADVAVFQPGAGRWLIRLSRTGTTNTFALGQGVDIYQLVSADYDGDGLADAAVYDSASGDWWIRHSRGAYIEAVTYGGPGYVAVN